MSALASREARRLTRLFGGQSSSAPAKVRPGCGPRAESARVRSFRSRGNEIGFGSHAFVLCCGLLLVAGCVAHGVQARSMQLGDPDAGAVEWLENHEPSRLDIGALSIDAVRKSDPDALLRAVPTDPKTACRQAHRDRALLLLLAPVEQPVLRSAALDCGFALWRDDRTVILAPR